MNDKNNKNELLVFTAKGVIREIPVEARGISKTGLPWTRGGLCLEVYDDDTENSAPLYLTAWGDEMVELINTLGVGKRVQVTFRITSQRKPYGQYHTNVSLESIQGLTENENYLYGTNNGQEQ